MTQSQERGPIRGGLASELRGTSGPHSNHLHQQPLLGRVLIAIGIVAGFLGLLEMLMVLPLGTADAQTYFHLLPRTLQMLVLAVPDGTPILLLALPGAVISVAGARVAILGRRHLVSTYDVTEPHKVKDPILYLRPFASDDAVTQQPGVPVFLSLFDSWNRAWMSVSSIHGLPRYEELLAYAFKRVGNVVTLGDPTERLPLLGATRIYAATPEPPKTPDAEDWKLEVAAQILNARLVLLHIGTSGALWWEIEKIVEVADPQRVVLCVHPPGKLKLSLPLFRKLRAEALEAWREFRDACGSAFPKGLPETIGDARFLQFEADWTARPVERPQRKLFWFIPGRDPDLSRRTVDSALAWLTWMLVPESSARRFTRKVVNFLLFVVALLLVGLLFLEIIGAL